MISLAEQQRLFALALRSDDTVDSIDRLQIDPGKGELTAEQRISIYRNHHRTSLAAALVTHFPTVVALIGGDAFDQLAADYVRQAPPNDPRLAFYGDGFADFLAIDSRLAALPYLADTARLDWALIKGQIAADHPAFMAADLAGISGDLLGDLCFGLHPAASLISSPYPLLDIRRLANGVAEPASTVDLAAGPSHLLVLRQNGEMVWQVLDEATSRFVTAIAAGTPLGVAADLTDEKLLPMLIGRFLVSGAFCRISLTD